MYSRKGNHSYSITHLVTFWCCWPVCTTFTRTDNFTAIALAFIPIWNATLPVGNCSTLSGPEVEKVQPSLSLHSQAYFRFAIKGLIQATEKSQITQFSVFYMLSDSTLLSNLRKNKILMQNCLTVNKWRKKNSPLPLPSMHSLQLSLFSTFEILWTLGLENIHSAHPFLLNPFKTSKNVSLSEDLENTINTSINIVQFQEELLE